jgi:hypothetical protein
MVLTPFAAGAALAMIALLAVLSLGAAPSTKKAADVVSPPATQPPATPTTSASDAVAPDAVQPLDQARTPGIPADPVAADANATYEIDWYSINGGGTVNASSASYKMGASIGQSVAGAASSASYKMGIGFWYGAGGGCACDCHADPGGFCDGVTDILDVAQAVNVAFRNAAALLDPNPNCPYQTTDANCSNSTDVVDVVKFVNVAFRNFSPATEFCNPCP